MSMAIVAQMVDLLANLLTILIIIWVIVSWILPPYHPLREALDRIIDPMLAPIRRVLPATGPIDFSPMILLIVIVLLSRMIVSLLLSVR
jgi:YggT family protein